MPVARSVAKGRCSRDKRGKGMAAARRKPWAAGDFPMFDRAVERLSGLRCVGLDPSAHRLLYFRFGNTPRAPLLLRLDRSVVSRIFGRGIVGPCDRRSGIAGRIPSMKTERRHELETNQLADSLGHWADAVRPYTNTILVGILLVVVGRRSMSSLSAARRPKPRRPGTTISPRSPQLGSAQAGRPGRSPRRHAGRLVVAVHGGRFGAGRGKQPAFPRQGCWPAIFCDAAADRYQTSSRRNPRTGPAQAGFVRFGTRARVLGRDQEGRRRISSDCHQMARHSFRAGRRKASEGLETT